MTYAFRRFFWPPTLETNDQTQRARTFHRVVLGTAAMLITLLVLLVAELPASFPRRFNSILYCISICVVLIPLNRAGHTRLASWLLVLSLTAINAHRAWTADGIAAPAVASFVVVVLMAGLLLGTRSGVIVALLCLSISLGMALAEQTGRLPPPEVSFSPIARWLATSMWLGLAFLLQREVAVSLGESLRRSEAELAERKQAEAALRAGERRFHALIENASVAIRVSRSGIAIYANRRFRDLFGFERAEELVGKSVLEQWAPESRELVERKNRMLLESTPDSAHYEAFGLRKDGTRFPMEVFVSVVELPDGRASFASFVDITARKEAAAAAHASEVQLRMLASHLQIVREAESRRIARAVHDEVGQLLTGLKMDLRWIEQGLEKRCDPETNAILDRVVGATQLVDETVTTVQRIAAELRPAILDQLGLFAALRHECGQLGQRASIDCRFAGPASEPTLSPDLATACYRIAQEALTNVVRHAAATAVTTEIQVVSGKLVLAIHDNGRGIALNAAKDINAHGLSGMRERARHQGGQVVIEPGATGGTLVRAEFPLQATSEKQ